MSKMKIGLRCPNCGKFLDEVKKMNYYKCVYCEWEVWPPEREDTPEKLAKAARQAYFEDVRVGYFGDGGKRSSGSKVKSRKKKPKALWTERYRLE